MSSPNNPQNPQDQNRPEHPGLWAAHAEYIKGAAEVRFHTFSFSLNNTLYPIPVHLPFPFPFFPALLLPPLPYSPTTPPTPQAAHLTHHLPVR